MRGKTIARQQSVYQRATQNERGTKRHFMWKLKKETGCVKIKLTFFSVLIPPSTLTLWFAEVEDWLVSQDATLLFPVSSGIGGGFLSSPVDTLSPSLLSWLSTAKTENDGKVNYYWNEQIKFQNTKHLLLQLINLYDTIYIQNKKYKNISKTHFTSK